MILRGELHRGHNGAAGELDYVRAGLGDEFDPCADAVSGLAASLVYSNGTGTSLEPPFDARAIFAAARQGDETATAVVREESRRIALHVVPLAAVTDVALVVLGGGLGALARNQVAAAIGVFVYLGSIDPLLAQAVPGYGEFGPTALGIVLSGGSPQPGGPGQHLLPPLIAAAVYLSYTAVSATAGLLAVARRELHDAEGASSSINSSPLALLLVPQRRDEECHALARARAD